MSTSLDAIKDRFPHALRLKTIELAAALALHPQSILNQISAKTFPIYTYVEGGKRYADIRDVADYLDGMRHKRGAGRPTKASKIEAKLRA